VVIEENGQTRLTSVLCRHAVKTRCGSDLKVDAHAELATLLALDAAAYPLVVEKVCAGAEGSQNAKLILISVALTNFGMNKKTDANAYRVISSPQD